MHSSASEAAQPAVSRFQSDNPDEFQDHVTKSLCPHRMVVARRLPSKSRLVRFRFADAQIVDISYRSNVRIDIEQPQDHYLVHASLSGATGYFNNGRRDSIDRDTVQITAPGVAAGFEMSEMCRHLTLRLPETVFAERLAQMNILFSRPVAFLPGGGSGREFTGMWRRTLGQLAAQIATVPHLMSPPSVQRQYTALLAELILTNCRNNYSDQIEVYGDFICPWHVKRARDIIHASVAENISIPALAAQVGVSARSLQNGFRQFLGVTPVEYIRSRRLEMLHAALLAGGAETSVTECMLDCGIANFGRYAQYYRDHYGRKPSDTLRIPAHAQTN